MCNPILTVKKAGNSATTCTNKYFLAGRKKIRFDFDDELKIGDVRYEPKFVDLNNN